MEKLTSGLLIAMCFEDTGEWFCLENSASCLPFCHACRSHCAYQEGCDVYELSCKYYILVHVLKSPTFCYIKVADYPINHFTGAYFAA